MLYFYLIGCVFFVGLQAFFAASEISFLSSRPVKLRHRQAKGDKRAAKIYKLMLEPEKFLTTTLIGINVSLVLSASLLTSFLVKSGARNSNLWITLFFTPVIVIFAELLPKNAGRLFREEFNYRTIEIISCFENLFSPAVKSVYVLNKFLVRLFIGKVKKRSLFVTKEEIKFIVNELQREGGIDKGEEEAIEDVFDFRFSKIKDSYVSLNRTVAFDYTDAYSRVLEIIRKNGFTRYPVFRNREVAGYINIYDLFYNPGENWQSFIRPVTKVGINQNLYEVFSRLKAKKENVALVIKGRKTMGIITLQDLTREIITSIIKI